TNNTNDLNFTYNVTPGTSANCLANPGITNCFVETDKADPSRTVTALISGTGLVPMVIDPMGRQYWFGWDSSADLTTLVRPSPTGSGTSWTYFGYTGGTGQYQSDLVTVTQPGAASPNLSLAYVNGMVHTKWDQYSNTTTYTYQYTDCANPT